MSKKKGKKNENEIIVRYTQTLWALCERHSVFITCVWWRGCAQIHIPHALKIHSRSHLHLQFTALLWALFSRSHPLPFSPLEKCGILCGLFVCIPHTHRTAQRSNICEVNVWFLFLFPNVRLLTQWFWWMPTSTPNVSHHMLQSHIHHIRGTKLFIKSKAKIFSFDNGAPFFWISVEHDNVFTFLSV